MKVRPLRALLSANLLFLLVLSAGSANASDRSFGYTLQSGVLAPGSSELEPWVTFRTGRERYFNRMDTRLEFEHGLTAGLQLALYLNATSKTKDVVSDPVTDTISRESETELSTSVELKYQFTDPVADALGSAVYLETTLATNEAEFEGKLILDRAIGNLLVAANVIGEYELEFVRDGEESEIEKSFKLEPTLAATYALSQSWKMGLELRAPLGLSGEAESSTLFAGPVASWTDAGYWMTLAVLPQWVAFSGESPGSHLDLDGQERLHVRLLAGFAL